MSLRVFLRGGTAGLAILAAPSCSLLDPPPPIQRLAETRRAEGPLVIAHRGASADYPENTLPAFRAGREAAAQMVELDFQQTRDGVLVCFHDRTLGRTTNCVDRGIQGTLRIADLDLARLQSLDAGAWKAPQFAGTQIPTLEAALRTILPGAIPMIEHKAGAPRKLVDLLRRLDIVDRVVVQSFDWDFLVTVHALEPALLLGALGGSDSRPRLDKLSRERLLETGARFVHWNHQRLSDVDLAWLHRTGYLAMVYTLNEREAIDAALRRGVDGVTTDRPRRARQRVAAMANR